MMAIYDLRGSKGYVKHPLASLSSAQPAMFHFVPGAGSVLPPANTDPGGYKMKRSWLILRGLYEPWFIQGRRESEKVRK